MKDGKAVGFAEDPSSELALDWPGDVTTLSGATVRLTTAWNLFMAEVNRYTPEAAAKLEAYARQIPQALHKSQNLKEYRHWLQHYGDYPRQNPAYSEPQRLVYKFRYRYGYAKSDELILNFEKYVRKQL